ncbi:hypothetical protein CFD26_106786 [Aspergillus turcosus]|uniref:Uncharacterized protein n=1 Tax=Aspergillus turcosus TaxID=1245748 RepID=A0A421D333_9EURO|nr:hypothetical protein CFD26_106786 [Aspergillus turcosus]
MSDYVIRPNTWFANKVPILDGPEDWWRWLVYIKGLALQNEVWRYIDPDDETITREKQKPVEPTRPVATKDFADMDQDEELAWEMELLEYNRLKRIYDEDVDGLRAVQLAIQNTIGEINWFHVYRRNISVRRLLIRLHDRIQPWVVGGYIDEFLPPEAAVVGM